MESDNTHGLLVPEILMISIISPYNYSKIITLIHNQIDLSFYRILFNQNK